MVDGSNESLWHADEEMQPFWRNFSPLQTIFNNFDVGTFYKISFSVDLGTWPWPGGTELEVESDSISEVISALFDITHFPRR